MNGVDFCYRTSPNRCMGEYVEYATEDDCQENRPISNTADMTFDFLVGNGIAAQDDKACTASGARSFRTTCGVPSDGALFDGVPNRKVIIEQYFQSEYKKDASNNSL